MDITQDHAPITKKSNGASSSNPPPTSFHAQWARPVNCQYYFPFFFNFFFEIFELSISTNL
jgi:hypothetical protein